MSKTAMQELIEWLDEDGDNRHPYYKAAILSAVTKATELLKKEKEQIVKAFNASEECTADSSGGRGVGGQTITAKYGSAESYYNQTYKP